MSIDAVWMCGRFWHIMIVVRSGTHEGVVRLPKLIYRVADNDGVHEAFFVSARSVYASAQRGHLED